MICNAPNGQARTTLAREILPRSTSIIEAFRTAQSRDHPGRQLLESANKLATYHQRQWNAEDASRAPDASAADTAAAKRLIDKLNTQRVALVEQIDTWATSQIRSPAFASLHTETLGSVVDRLAIAWVRVNSLVTADGFRDRTHLALLQLTELADAYDDLIRDVAAGYRRLPAWRPLKVYRSSS